MISSNSQQLVVLPRGQHTKLCAVIDHQIVDLAPLSFPAKGIFRISESGWVACITKKGRKISLGRIGSDDKFNHFPSIPMPEKYKDYAIALAGDVLYVGGRCGKEVLGFFDLKNEQPSWTPLQIPVDLMKYGKSIDDLLIDGNRLIAIDNIVYPKYILVYDISKPANPRLKIVKDLPWHGPYEHILMGAIGEDYLAILSESAGTGGSGRHIGILDKSIMCEIYFSSSFVDHESLIDEIIISNHEKHIRWNSIAFIDNMLLISAGHDDIGILDTSKLSQSSIQRHRVYDLFCRGELLEDDIRYVMPKTLPKSNIVYITPCQYEKDIIVEIRINGKLQSFLIALSDLLSDDSCDTKGKESMDIPMRECKPNECSEPYHPNDTPEFYLSESTVEHILSILSPDIISDKDIDTIAFIKFHEDTQRRVATGDMSPAQQKREVDAKAEQFRKIHGAWVHHVNCLYWKFYMLVDLG